MCTISWLFHDGGYELFCNRDETRWRALALAPRRRERSGVAYLSPEDGDAGGTWITINEVGLGLCLLNRYPEPPGERFVSRGLLVRELAGAATAEEVESRLLEIENGLEPSYRPFTLLALDPQAAPLVMAWNGRHLVPSAGPVRPPLSSSSFDPAGIGEARRRLWDDMLERELGGREPVVDDLMAFHCSHRPARGPYSPCMHRDDARTVSLTRVRVTRAAVEMAYAAGPPCRATLSRPLTLMRQPSRRPALRRAVPVV